MFAVCSFVRPSLVEVVEGANDPLSYEMVCLRHSIEPGLLASVYALSSCPCPFANDIDRWIDRSAPGDSRGRRDAEVGLRRGGLGQAHAASAAGRDRVPPHHAPQPLRRCSEVSQSVHEVWLVVRAVDRSVGRSVRRSVGRSVGRLVGRPVGRSVG